MSEKRNNHRDSVQSLSNVRLSVTLWNAAHQAPLFITNSGACSNSCPTKIKLVMPSSYLILCRPLLLPPSIFPSIRVFSNESVLHIRWSKCWRFSFNNSPSSEYSGLISQDLLVGSPCSPRDTEESSPTPQFKSIYSWVLSFPYGPTLTSIHGKTTALTLWTFVGKVKSLLFNMLSRLVIAFLPRSKCLLLLWQQSPSALILEPKKIKSVTVFMFPHLFACSDGTRCHDLSFLNVEF